MEAHNSECPANIRVLVASDVRLYREALEQMLRGTPGIEVIASVGGAEPSLDEIRDHAPDVVLLDMAMDGAYALARQVARTSRNTKVVALGMPEAEAAVISCAEVGISGYVTRTGSANDAIEAIRAAARGEVRCSPKIAGFLFRHIAALSGERNGTDPVAGLTAREMQILRLLQQGLSNKMISRNLGIELPTVKNHVHSLLNKLGVHRRAEAVSLLHRKTLHESAPQFLRQSTPK
ncbi:MAG: response regulator transcription factor [Steroidobacteraceae bacterium]|jgi:DNA-binding NarL/FixJ family response regulator|nr:response regulator transcription factor [Steroidobacteraceae bacterium]